MRRLMLPLTAGMTLVALTVLAVGGGADRPSFAAPLGASVSSSTALASAPGDVRAVQTPAHTDVNAFSFDSFDVVYQLGRDAEGHATLVTTETLVAQFPQFDQNRGVRRSIPATYQGHSTQLQVLSVTDEDGRPRPYEVSYGTVADIVAAVPEGQFVRGQQTYVISYVQRDVVDAFENSAAEEFYWNLNGTDWPQPFGRVSARIELEDGLADDLLGQAACYRGYAGSTERCTITRDGNTFVVDERALAPFQTVTVAIGFAPGTFTLFDRSYLASPWAWFQLFGLLLSVVAAVSALALRFTRYRDAPGRPVLIAEYQPPADLSLLEAAVLTRRRTRAVASQLVDFAVRGVMTIIEVPGGWFGLRSTWRLRLESADGVTGEERLLLAKFFGGALVSGSEHTLTARNTTLSAAIQRQLVRIEAAIAKRGWRRIVAPRDAVGLTVLVVVGNLIAFVSGINVTDEGREGDLGGLVMPLIFVLFFVVALSLYRRPLTETGAELVDHIRGLEMYIELAEAERLRVLQSPQGALREPIDPTNRAERLKLIERLLPWAVLTKHEKEWAEQLGSFLEEGQSPRWFSSTRPFTVTAFAAGVTSVSSTLSSSYSGSSSSGGSSGGGSSGGGGGGGGGGGV